MREKLAYPIAALCIMLWLPFAIVGLILNYTAKLLNIMGFILTLNFRTATEEMNWTFKIHPTDVIDRFHFLRKHKQ